MESAPRRYRINPIEIAILGAVTCVFAHSAYTLVNGRDNFEFAALTPMVSTPISEGRAPASIPSTTASVNVKCDENQSSITTASRIRLTGTLCGVDAGPLGANLAKTAVVNQVNSAIATIFTDVDSGGFTTEYIPLAAGKNAIHVEFTYRDGKTVSHNLEITRN